MKLLVFTDISGNYDAFYQIAKKYPNHIKISNGDINDRYLQTKQLLDYFMKKKRTMAIYGNHEDIMVDFYRKTNRYSKSCWFINGGKETVLSFIRSHKLKRDFSTLVDVYLEKETEDIYCILHEVVVKYIPEKYIIFMENLPWFYETDSVFISHAPIAPKLSIEEFKEQCLKKNFNMLWNRKISKRKREKFCIFGHEASLDVVEYPNAVNLDSSWGDQLSAYDLDAEEFIVIEDAFSAE